MIRAWIVAAVAVLAVPAAALETPSATRLTVTQAAVTAGKVVIRGTTNKPGATVSILGTSYKAKVSAKGTFLFRLVYWLPPTCKATLALGTKKVPIVLANCGPRGLPGVTVQGDWKPEIAYSGGQIVSFGGASYVALTAAAAGVEPGSPGGNGVWGVLAAKGAEGKPAVAKSIAIPAEYPDLAASPSPPGFGPWTLLGGPTSSWTTDLVAGQSVMVHATANYMYTNNTMTGRANILHTVCMKGPDGVLVYPPGGVAKWGLLDEITDGSGSVIRTRIPSNGILTATQSGVHEIGLCAANPNGGNVYVGTGHLSAIVLN